MLALSVWGLGKLKSPAQSLLQELWARAKRAAFRGSAPERCPYSCWREWLLLYISRPHPFFFQRRAVHASLSLQTFL